MLEAAELAGMMAAHAVWLMSDGDLIPMLAHVNAAHERSSETFPGDRETAMAAARKQLTDNPMNATAAVLIYSMKRRDNGTTAILVELHVYATSSRLLFIVPFAYLDGHFVAEKAQFKAKHNCDGVDDRDVMRAFSKGVESHPNAAAVWKRARTPPN